MNNNLIRALAQQSAVLNVSEPIPLGAIQFENSNEYIFFAGQSAPNYITFETI